MITASEITESLGSMLRERRAGSVKRFRHVVVDSRQAGRGDLFVALAGERRDGHEFQLDFPKLVHRYKAQRAKRQGVGERS